MEIKKIRRMASMIGGAAAALFAIIFLFYADTAIKTSVAWMIGIACLGLLGGAALFIGSFMTEDEENLKSPFVLGTSVILLIGYIVVLFFMMGNEEFVKFGKYHVLYYILFYPALVFGIAALLASLFTFVSDLLDEIKYLQERKANVAIEK